MFRLHTICQHTHSLASVSHEAECAVALPCHNFSECIAISIASLVRAAHILMSLQKEQGGRQAGPVPPDFSSLAPLTVSITGEARQLTIEEFTSMSVPCFQELWTVGALLLYRLPCRKQSKHSLQRFALL